MSLVPDGFVAPPPIRTDQFRLELLGPQHHESDYAAWTSSIDFIRSLPGWATSHWPYPMSKAENLRDCESHLVRSRAGSDFAYTVLRPAHDPDPDPDPDPDVVIGCVYFTPTDPPRPNAVAVRSWVTAEHADLDAPLHAAVTGWLSTDWPWTDVEYDPR
jgi:hypothetical protein